VGVPARSVHAHIFRLSAAFEGFGKVAERFQGSIQEINS
jgi:hypothetical protein